MATRDGIEGYLLTCDRCSKDGTYDEFNESEESSIRREIWENALRVTNSGGRVVTYHRAVELFNADFCQQCQIEITPLVLRMGDILNLIYYVNNLERAIKNVVANRKGRGNKNNRRTANGSGALNQMGAQWFDGFGQGNGSSQAGEEHF